MTEPAPGSLFPELPDPPQSLSDLLGKRVTVTNPGNGSAWTGQLLGYGSTPCLLIRRDSDSENMCLPQSFTVAEAGDAPDLAVAPVAELGARIRAARKGAGLTQEALAEALGVTQTAVSYWEAGKRDPGIADLLRVAEAVGVPAASLLPAADPLPPQDGAQGRLARVEVKGFRDLGIVRVTESTLAGEPMLRAEAKDGAVAEFPASSLHFITWLPDRAELAPGPRIAIPSGWRQDDDLDDGDFFDPETDDYLGYAEMPADSGPF